MKKGLFIIPLIVLTLLVSSTVPAYATTCNAKDTNSATNGGCAQSETCKEDSAGSSSGTCVSLSTLTTPTATTPGTGAVTVPTTATSAAGTATYTFQPLTQIPGIKDIANSSTLPNFLNQLYKICVGAGTVLAVLMIMYAGVEFMTSKDSVTSNEKAKTHIQNAILGLVLILSPTVVFTIINPDILKLNIDLSGLQQTQAVATPASTAATPDASCSTYKNVTVTTAGKTCTDLGAGYSSIDGTCCSTVQSGGSCCAQPSTYVAPTWAWSFRFVTSSNGAGAHTQSGGPFPTQQSCQASYADFVKNNPNQLQQDTFCDCTKPKDQWDNKCQV